MTLRGSSGVSGNFHGVGRGLYTTQGDASVTKLTLSPEGRNLPFGDLRIDKEDVICPHEEK